MAAHLKNELGLFPALPWGNTRRDARAACRLLTHAGIDQTSALGVQISAVLIQRVSDCRDFFVLRGARTCSQTVLRMAARSLAGDRHEATRLDVNAAGQGQILLRSLSNLAEQIARSGPPTRFQRLGAAKLVISTSSNDNAPRAHGKALERRDRLALVRRSPVSETGGQGLLRAA